MIIVDLQCFIGLLTDTIHIYMAVYHTWHGERALHGASGLAAMDIIAAGVGAGGLVQVLFYDYDLADAPPDYPRPWRDYMGPAWITMLVVM